MFAVVYRFVKLAWRYRRLIALGLTLVGGLIERHRAKLPAPLQKVDLSKVPGVKVSAGTRDTDAA
ncbi:MAG: hypothetical protein QM648_03410 [Solirubrobacterales bacterium]